MPVCKMSSWHVKLSRFFRFRIKAKNEGHRKKCGKDGKVLDFPHDCRTVDTCVVYLLEDAF